MFTGQNLNLYHYSHQNPVRYTDPDGNATAVAGCVIGTPAGPIGCVAGAIILTGISVAIIASQQSDVKPVAKPTTRTRARTRRRDDNDGNYVYRGLNASESLAAAVGLTATNPFSDASPQSHVLGKKDSPWISTTKDPNIARTKYDRGFGVVRIDLDKVPSQVLDISSGNIPGGTSPRARAYAKHDKEVLIRSYIPPTAIELIQ